MHQLAEGGAGIIMVSSELLELIGMSSRIMVMRDGALCSELNGEGATEESVMLAATGVEA
jgi:rhamnose transport system ATP-binding protein